MRLFLKRVLLAFIPLLLVIITVNYYGDAGNLFGQAYEKQIANELIKKHNVTNVLNCDERLLQKFFINNSSICPDIVIIGSSRVMEIHATSFKDSTVYNNGVSGASVEDLLAITQLYIQKKCVPKKIIIGLDPWTLNKNSGQTRWRTLDTEYKVFLSQMPVNKQTKENEGLKKRLINIARNNLKYYQLISPSYFKNSIYTLFFVDKKLHVTTNALNRTFTMLYDGSISYDYNYRVYSSIELQKRVSKYTQGDFYSIEHFNNLDNDCRIKLEFLVSFLQQKGVTVEFFLAPYHPVVYKKIYNSTKYKEVMASEIYYRSLAAKNNIKVIGSFNPAVLKLDSSCFLDGMHCNDTTVNKIIANGN